MRRSKEESKQEEGIANNMQQYEICSSSGKSGAVGRETHKSSGARKLDVLAPSTATVPVKGSYDSDDSSSSSDDDDEENQGPCGAGSGISGSKRLLCAGSAFSALLLAGLAVGTVFVFTKPDNNNLAVSSGQSESSDFPQSAPSTSVRLTLIPSGDPTSSPTIDFASISRPVTPTHTGSRAPSAEDVTNTPSAVPSTPGPTVPTVEPTQSPTVEPTHSPTGEPTLNPTTKPTQSPTIEPSSIPTMVPTPIPTMPPTQSWVQRGEDIVGDEESSTSWSVAISDDGRVVAVGAWAAANADGVRTGHTRIFVYSQDTDTWDQFGGDIIGENGDDMFGWSVSLSGNGVIVAIGARSSDGKDGALVDSGHVRTFLWNGFFWGQLGDAIEGAGSLHMAGWSTALSIDGSTVAIGIPSATVDNIVVGHVRVLTYDNQANSWIQIGANIEGENAGDQFGHSVSLNDDGTVVVVGAPGSGRTGERSGHVQVYSLLGNTWSEFGSPLVGYSSGDETGHSISISGEGSILSVGGPGVDGVAGENSGEVRVFFWSGIFWFQLGDAIEGLKAGDKCGASVSLSSDGNTLAVGAPGSGNAAGYSRLFRWDSAAEAWKQLANSIVGDKAGDSSGRVVSVSGDGSRFAVGAMFSQASDESENQGFTRVYDLIL